MNESQKEPVHYRAPVARDTRVATCTRKWCSWNTTDWDKVTCPDCLLFKPEAEPVVHGAQIIDLFEALKQSLSQKGGVK